MQNLLRTILTELENHKLMFRANAYELWNYGCEDMIVPWGYDQDALIKTFKEVELDPRGGNIIIQHEDRCVEHKDLIARIKKDFLEDEEGYTIGVDSKEWLNSLSDDEIIKDFNEQAKLLDPYVDFFYFDVWSSIKEFRCGIKAIKEFNKPYLIGIHISEGTKLPSGENISDIKDIIDQQLLGIILACVSPENYEINLKELKNLNVPFGFKINGYITTKPKNGYSATFAKLNGNPNEFLGHREDLTPEKVGKITKKYKDNGATILGGCCETRPLHISAMANIK